MGTTIRREPVNFAIPAAPDYKFLNITNFRGLDVSSNPFELATNTASDCLNVYVDETNTLTTRPRLEKKIATPIDGEHIGTYNLHNGYLLHYLVNGVGVMKTLIDSTLTDINGEEIPITKCQYFEHGDKIYLLDGNRYMVISDNTLADVEGYVPTTSITSLKGDKKTVENLNILSNKYIEKLFWNIDTDVNLTDVTDYENLSFIKDETSTGLYGDNTSFKIVKESSNNIYTHLYLNYIENGVTTTVYDFAELFPDISTSGADFESAQVHENKIYWYRESTTGYTACVYYNGSDWIGKYLGVISAGYPIGHLSDDGFTYIDAGDGSIKDVVLYDIVVTDNSVNKTTVSKPNHGVILAKLIEDILIVWFTRKISISVGRNDFVDISDIINGSVKGVGVGKNNVVWVFASSGFHILDASTGTLKVTQQPKIKIDYMFSIKDYRDSAWFVDKLTGKIHIIPNIYNINNYVWSGMTLSMVPYFSVNITDSYITSDKVYINYKWYNNGSYITQEDTFKRNNTTEPTIIVHKSITSSNKEYDDWSNKLKRFLESELVTRFDNNYWFANKNRYYRSQYNDPTYFPITEYNDLGDSNEEITGFNLANDSTLIAYKKNKVYLIQPFTSSLDTTEYTITESKNTVGNTAIGAPIVTTLTEIPLQINNDGIYGLSQLSNVSATERIADLMSEPINERWLDIDDALIRNAKTLNRLYWTYIIIPRSDNTQIYLLDNRSNSWYYWELPIVVADAFVKNNITEFSDINGNIYYLTATDIINKSFDTQLVTEYYDDGRQLINWYWQSQILPMGTMNYSKRLVNTTFILTDTDDSDGYGLNYSFKVFRKLASSTPEKELTGELNLVRSTTKKTNISKFGFLQLKLSNITEESQGTEPEKAFRNNKLRLVGLGLKYVLLEGLIR